MQRTVLINGLDFTDCFDPRYSVTYPKVQGQNAGLMLNGTYTDDIIAQRGRFSMPTGPVPEARLQQLLQVLTSDDYVTVYIYDPRDGTFRTGVMRVEIDEMEHLGTGSAGREYWNGPTVTFEDRFDIG